MPRPRSLPAILLAIGACACGDPRKDMVGSYPVTGTFELTANGSTQTGTVKEGIKITSDPSSSDRLSVAFSDLKCTPSAKMTGTLAFSIDRTECSPLPAEDDGCTVTLVMEQGTGSKVEAYSELVIKVAGPFITTCPDGSQVNGSFTLSTSGFRVNTSSTEPESEPWEDPLERPSRASLPVPPIARPESRPLPAPVPSPVEAAVFLSPRRFEGNMPGSFARP